MVRSLAGALTISSRSREASVAERPKTQASQTERHGTPVFNRSFLDSGTLCRAHFAIMGHFEISSLNTRRYDWVHQKTAARRMH